jgi:hypothetical protein
MRFWWEAESRSEREEKLRRREEERQRRRERRIDLEEAHEYRRMQREHIEDLLAALPPKDSTEQAPQRSDPSLSEWDRQRGTPSPADNRKFCLQLIFVILSLWLCVMGSCVIVTIIGFLWGQ